MNKDPHWFKASFHKTSTDASKILPDVRNDSLDRFLYQVIFAGHEFNKSGYYHKRQGGISCLLLYTNSGSAKLTYQGKKYDLTPGSFAFLNLEKENVIEAPNDEWEIYYAHVLGGDTIDIYQKVTQTKGNFIQHFDAENFKRYIDAIYEAYINKMNPYYISSQIYMMLMDILEKTIEKEDLSNSTSAALRYIHSNYNTNMSIDSMCKELYISKYYFIRKFKKEVGCTPKKYLTKIRVDKARMLIVTTNKTIVEIAQLCGFKDEENIYYAFKKEINASPEFFKKRIWPHK